MLESIELATYADNKKTELRNKLGYKTFSEMFKATGYNLSSWSKASKRNKKNIDKVVKQIVINHFFKDFEPFGIIDMLEGVDLIRVKSENKELQAEIKRLKKRLQ